MTAFSKDKMTEALIAHVETSDVGMEGRVGDADMPEGDRSSSGYLPVVTIYLVPGGERWGPPFVRQDSENVDYVIRSVGSSPLSARRMADHVRDILDSEEFDGYEGWSCLQVDLAGSPGGISREDEGAFKVWSVTETYRFTMTSS